MRKICSNKSHDPSEFRTIVWSPLPQQWRHLSCFSFGHWGMLPIAMYSVVSVLICFLVRVTRLGNSFSCLTLLFLFLMAVPFIPDLAASLLRNTSNAGTVAPISKNVMSSLHERGGLLYPDFVSLLRGASDGLEGTGSHLPSIVPTSNG
jgi:hypothetical protein